MPGVVAAGIANQLPLAGEGGNNLLSREGSHLPLMERPLVDIRNVNPEYFAAMSIPLQQGRCEEDEYQRLHFKQRLHAFGVEQVYGKQEHG